MNKSWFFFGLFLAVFFSFSSVSALSPSDFGLQEGDLISAIFSDDPDVYIVNEHGYKRLFLNPEIFKFYSHLGGFANVKLVTPEIRDSFPTTGLFRNCEKKDPKVYGFESDNEDNGKLRWIDTPGDQAVQDDPDFFKKVFCINDKEFRWYPKGEELKSVNEVSQYHRKTIPATPAVPATPVVPVSSSKPFAPAASVSQPLVPSATPKPASGSFSPTPTPTPITLPATPAMPAQPATSIPTPTPASIIVTYPNGGETWEYNLNYRLGYVLNGISASRIGVKLFKGSSVVYETTTSTTWGDGTFHVTLNGSNASSIGSGNDYKIRIYNQDNPAEYDDSDNYFFIPTVADTTPPVVSSVLASPITANSATITWTTDEPATGYVNYGSTPTNWAVTPQNTSYTTSHSFTLSNLTSGTQYTFRVYSVDASGNGPQGYPPEHIFTTSLSIPTPSFTATVSFDNFSRDLYLGSKGDDVKKLQALLMNEVNYSANLITGYFGQITKEAVKRLQEKLGIQPVSGYFGELTRRALRALISH